MENKDNIHELLSNSMNWRSAEAEAPELSQMTAARHAVIARKKQAPAKQHVLQLFLAFFNFDLKFYHLGVCVLLMMVGTFYITETHYGAGDSQNYTIAGESTLSIKGSTISVNSSTMLTSIPTLRN